MEDQIANYTTLLKKQLKQLKKEEVDWKLWKSTTVNLLQRIFGLYSHQVQQIKAIKHETSIGLSGYIYRDNIEECINRAKGLMQAYLDELHTFGLPTSVQSKEAATKKTNNETKLINDILEYELTGRQHKELQQILTNKEWDEAKKVEELMDKMKTFGNEVVAHILARIVVESDK